MSGLCSRIVYLSLFLFCTGCGGSERVVEVTGVVTHGGKPIPHLVIHFTGEKGGSKSGATTDEEGRFTALHASGKNGVEVGTHKIWVSIDPPEKEDKDGKKIPKVKRDPELVKVLKEKQELKLELD